MQTTLTLSLQFSCKYEVWCGFTIRNHRTVWVTQMNVMWSHLHSDLKLQSAVSSKWTMAMLCLNKCKLSLACNPCENLMNSKSSTEGLSKDILCSSNQWLFTSLHVFKMSYRSLLDCPLCTRLKSMGAFHMQ